VSELDECAMVTRPSTASYRFDLQMRWPGARLVGAGADGDWRSVRGVRGAAATVRPDLNGCLAYSTTEKHGAGHHRAGRGQRVRRPPAQHSPATIAMAVRYCIVAPRRSRAGGFLAAGSVRNGDRAGGDLDPVGGLARKLPATTSVGWRAGCGRAQLGAGLGASWMDAFQSLIHAASNPHTLVTLRRAGGGAGGH